MRHTRQSLASALALLLLPGAAAAVEPLDTVSFSVGSYVSRFDTRIRADGQILDGTTVDLSRDLGLDPEDLLAFARRISASVLETFGVPIEPEPRLVGARW